MNACARCSKPARYRYCGEECRAAWRTLADRIFDRDHGICARCGRDTEAARVELTALQQGITTELARSRRARILCDDVGYMARMRELLGIDNDPLLRGRSWVMVPKHEPIGGTLADVKTVCRACRKAGTIAKMVATKAERFRRARAAADPQLALPLGYAR